MQVDAFPVKIRNYNNALAVQVCRHAVYQQWRCINTRMEFINHWLNNEEQRHLLSFPVVKRKVDWLSGRIAAKLAVCNYTMKRLNVKEISIDYNDNRRPFFADYFVSISHSQLLAVALVGDSRLGIDTECNTRLTHNNISPLITKEEITQVCIGNDIENQQAKTLIWCLKEALFKTFGENNFINFAKKIRIIYWSRGVVRWHAPLLEQCFPYAASENWNIDTYMNNESVTINVRTKHPLIGINFPSKTSLL